MDKSFEEFFFELGLAKDPSLHLIEDGQIQRFSITSDRSGELSGWYLYTGDYGVVGNWKSNMNHHWFRNQLNDLPRSQSSELQKKMQLVKRQQKVDQQQRQAQVATEAKELLGRLDNESACYHPYLVKKGICAHGLGVFQGKLIIPLLDAFGDVVSYQEIWADGSKRFKKGGRKKGCFYPIGGKADQMLVCEGYATGASLFEATGIPVLVAFDAGNLKPVIEEFKRLHAGISLLVAADNDHTKDKNTGLSEAKEIYEELGIGYLYPEFEPDDSGSDFNDWLKSNDPDQLVQAVYGYFQKEVA